MFFDSPHVIFCLISLISCFTELCVVSPRILLVVEVFWDLLFRGKLFLLHFGWGDDGCSFWHPDVEFSVDSKYSVTASEQTRK